MSIRRQHLLDQYIALSLDVQARLRSHFDRLVEAGWEPEAAREFCYRIEERILAPSLDLSMTAAMVMDRLERMIREETEPE